MNRSSSFWKSRECRCGPRKLAQRTTPARIVRVPVFHEGTFRALLLAALRAGRCVRHAGAYWQPIHAGHKLGVYSRATYDLTWIQERVDDYERFFYSRLLQAQCGPDDLLRPRTKLVRGAAGAYRRVGEAPRRRG